MKYIISVLQHCCNLSEYQLPDDIACSPNELCATRTDSLVRRTISRRLLRQVFQYLLNCLAFLAVLIVPAICSAQKIPPVVCIDPGHPSEVNPGFQVQNGTTETHIDWVVAIKLQKLLKAKGFTVVMTKSKEKQMVRNKERALIANRAGAAMMVRLHCDSSTDTGYAIYYPNRTGTAQGVTGPSAEVRGKSRAAAEAVESMMKPGLEGSLKSGGVRGDDKTFVGGKQGALTGSIFSKVPIITIEMVVLNNRHDADFIKKNAGQLKMAQAIAAGIEKFVGSPE